MIKSGITEKVTKYKVRICALSEQGNPHSCRNIGVDVLEHEHIEKEFHHVIVGFQDLMNQNPVAVSLKIKLFDTEESLSETNYSIHFQNNNAFSIQDWDLNKLLL